MTTHHDIEPHRTMFRRFAWLLLGSGAATMLLLAILAVTIVF